MATLWRGWRRMQHVWRAESWTVRRTSEQESEFKQRSARARKSLQRSVVVPWRLEVASVLPAAAVVVATSAAAVSLTLAVAKSVATAAAVAGVLALTVVP